MPQLDFLTFITQFVWFTFVFVVFYFISSFFFFPFVFKALKVRKYFVSGLQERRAFYDYLLNLNGNRYAYYIYKLVVKSTQFRIKFSDSIWSQYLDFFFSRCIYVKKEKIFFFKNINVSQMVIDWLFITLYLKYIHWVFTIKS